MVGTTSSSSTHPGFQYLEVLVLGRYLSVVLVRASAEIIPCAYRYTGAPPGRGGTSGSTAGTEELPAWHSRGTVNGRPPPGTPRDPVTPR